MLLPCAGPTAPLGGGCGPFPSLATATATFLHDVHGDKSSSVQPYGEGNLSSGVLERGAGKGRSGGGPGEGWWPLLHPCSWGFPTARGSDKKMAEGRFVAGRLL